MTAAAAIKDDDGRKTPLSSTRNDSRLFGNFREIDSRCRWGSRELSNWSVTFTKSIRKVKTDEKKKIEKMTFLYPVENISSITIKNGYKPK